MWQVVVFATVALGIFARAARAEEVSAKAPSITVDDSGEWLAVTLENSVFRAVIRVNEGGDYGHEHAIRDLVLKSSGRDQVEAFIDACAQRPPLKSAEVIAADDETSTVRLAYAAPGGETKAVSEATIFRDSPVIRIDYVQYTPWTNTVDIGHPGGQVEAPDGGIVEVTSETRIYGQEKFLEMYKRDLVYHEESYWNTFDAPQKETDPADAGPLNYNGHMIMAVAGEENGEGFGRVMPIRMEGKGGNKILKLLWDKGFECFPATGDQERLPFTGYVYVFTGGLDEAIEMGKKIVDGDICSGKTAS